MEHLQPSPLDNPVWSALTTKHAHLGQASELAGRYHPDVAPFAGLANMSTEAFQSLGLLIPPSGYVFLLAPGPLPPLDGMQSEYLCVIRQMLDVGTPGSVSADGVVRLSDGYAEAMLELVRKTQPGPFGRRTHEMGNYIGIRDGERLVAMAGERMRCAGHAEISAVCVDDDHRGQGIAARLMNILRHEMRQRGETPFLHVRDDNLTAIALYERLGFETRQRFHLYRLTAGRGLE
jgi:ribosomal protein S18 acetylase RimI-like enzyme